LWPHPSKAEIIGRKGQTRRKREVAHPLIEEVKSKRTNETL